MEQNHYYIVALVTGVLTLVSVILIFVYMRQQSRMKQTYKNELFAHESLLQSLIDENPAIIILKDSEGRFIFGNKALANLYGTTKEDLVGKDDGAFNPNKEQVDFYRKNVKEVLAKGETAIVMEQSTDVATGKTRYYQSTKKPILDANGNKTLLIIANDVTQLMLAQKNAEDSATRLQYVLEATGDGIWDWDLATNKLVNNARWCHMLGYPESEVVHNLEQFSSRLLQEEVPGIMDAINGCLEGRGKYFHEHRMKRTDGEIIWVRDRGNVVERDEDGKPLRMIGAVTDITEQKNAEFALQSAKNEAESASRSKSQFLATMSHEIRTPLNGVLGMVDILQNTTLDERQQHYTETIAESGKHLLGVIEDILDFSKIEADRLELNHEPFNLQLLINAVTELLSEQAHEKELELKIEIDEKITGNLLGDPQRLRQVLFNLIGNAIKFTDKGAVVLSVKVEVITSKFATIYFEVKDTGIGVSESDQRRIFSAFSQADSSTTRRFEGTGLGLPIAGSLVRLMGGEIKLVSNPESGSCFSFSLQFERTHKQVVVETELTPGGNTELGNGYQNVDATVLVVEDNAVNREVVVEMLEQYGLQVVAMDNAASAIKVFKVTDFDLVFMDLHMPGLGGLEACRIIRDFESGKQRKSVPVIALTADVVQDIQDECNEAGMNDYVSKPVSRQRLMQVVRHWLSIAPSQEFHSSSEVEVPVLSNDVLDHASLMNLALGSVPGKKPLLQRTFEIYQSNGPELIAQIDSAIKNSNAQGLAEAAHTLKSSSGFLGAIKVSEISLQLEEMGLSGVIAENASELYGAVKAAYDEALVALAEYVEQNT